jgi:hypothetical protein
MANLTEEEDKELKRTDFRNSDIRRDFSVIHSKQMKKNHLFLGPARFVNVSTFFVLLAHTYVPHDSTIATTIVSCSAKEGILLSGFSGLSLLEKRSLLIMATVTVRPLLSRSPSLE